MPFEVHVLNVLFCISVKEIKYDIDMKIYANP